MIAEPDRLTVARNAAKRSSREMPFAIWMALAKATPVNFCDVESEDYLGQPELNEH